MLTTAKHKLSTDRILSYEHATLSIPSGYSSSPLDRLCCYSSRRRYYRGLTTRRSCFNCRYPYRDYSSPAAQKEISTEMFLSLTPTFLVLIIFAVLFGLTVVITGVLFGRALVKYRQLKQDSRDPSEESSDTKRK